MLVVESRESFDVAVAKGDGPCASSDSWSKFFVIKGIFNKICYQCSNTVIGSVYQSARNKQTMEKLSF